MEKIIFELSQDYITLVNILKYEGIISTGGEIIHLIDNNSITYNGVLESRKRKKLYSGDVVVVNEEIKIEIK